MRVAGKSLEQFAEYGQAQAMAELFQPEMLHMVDFPIRTGCPALTAKTKDGKIIVEQFCEDVLALLDIVYFPYWDK